MHYSFNTEITDCRSNYPSCGKCCSYSLIATNDFRGKNQLEQQNSITQAFFSDVDG